jgi:hypothetical protein
VHGHRNGAELRRGRSVRGPRKRWATGQQLGQKSSGAGVVGYTSQTADRARHSCTSRPAQDRPTSFNKFDYAEDNPVTYSDYLGYLRPNDDSGPGSGTVSITDPCQLMPDACSTPNPAPVIKPSPPRQQLPNIPGGGGWDNGPTPPTGQQTVAQANARYNSCRNPSAAQLYTGACNSHVSGNCIGMSVAQQYVFGCVTNQNTSNWGWRHDLKQLIHEVSLAGKAARSFQSPAKPV